jgi:hypothetical protein
MTSKSKKIQVLVQESDFTEFQIYAESIGTTMSDILRRYVKEVLQSQKNS